LQQALVALRREVELAGNKAVFGGFAGKQSKSKPKLRLISAGIKGIPSN
jgi:hypothetical protein